MAHTVPTLAQVLALRPASGDAATFRAAVGQAEAMQAAMIARATALDASRDAGLLSAETAEILALDQQVTQARLAADRLEALLPLLRDDLADAEGRAVLAELRRETADANAATAALEAWQAKDMRRIAEIMAVGFDLEGRAVAAHAALMARADAAYRLQAVRDGGPIGIDLTPLPASRPRAAFPGWR
jgi:hypothetical protein